MDLRITALIAASLIGSAVFVGCSCSKSVDNDEKKDMNQIEMENDVTLSSETSSNTTKTEYAASTSAVSETTVSSESETTTTGTSRSVKIQYVGVPGGRTTTTQHATQIVIVTVTLPKTTEEIPATTEASALVTQNMPDASFSPDRDMYFTSESLVIRVGDINNSLSSYAQNYYEGMPVHGGSTAYAYDFGGDFTVQTETLTNPDGSSGEVITDIIIKSDKVCTNKGIKKGSSIDEIYAAYGTEKCINEEMNIYKYKTDDGCVMEFYTDGSFVTDIKYRMENR